MNKELAIKIFREAAEYQSETAEFACNSLSSICTNYNNEIAENIFVSLVWKLKDSFMPEDGSHGEAWYTNGAKDEFEFGWRTEKGKLGRAIMLELMAEMIEMGDVEV